MNTFETWGDTITGSLKDLWNNFINFLPNFIGAVLVIILGWLVAIWIGKLVERIFKLVRLNRFFEKIKAKEAFDRVGVQFDISKWLGFIAKWFLIIVFITAATDILGLHEVTTFLRRFVLYLPNVIIAAIILVLGILFANWAQRFLHNTIKAGGLVSANLIAGLAKWAIILFSALAALVQLRIAADLLQILFTGIVGMLALAGGLAFGLGGKEKARDFLEKFKKDISE